MPFFGLKSNNKRKQSHIDLPDTCAELVDFIKTQAPFMLPLHSQATNPQGPKTLEVVFKSTSEQRPLAGTEATVGAYLVEREADHVFGKPIQFNVLESGRGANRYEALVALYGQLEVQTPDFDDLQARHRALTEARRGNWAAVLNGQNAVNGEGHRLGENANKRPRLAATVDTGALDRGDVATGAVPYPGTSGHHAVVGDAVAHRSPVQGVPALQKTTVVAENAITREGALAGVYTGYHDLPTLEQLSTSYSSSTLRSNSHESAAAGPWAPNSLYDGHRGRQWTPPERRREGFIPTRPLSDCLLCQPWNPDGVMHQSTNVHGNPSGASRGRSIPVGMLCNPASPHGGEPRSTNVRRHFFVTGRDRCMSVERICRPNRGEAQSSNRTRNSYCPSHTTRLARNGSHNSFSPNGRERSHLWEGRPERAFSLDHTVPVASHGYGRGSSYPMPQSHPYGASGGAPHASQYQRPYASEHGGFVDTPNVDGFHLPRVREPRAHTQGDVRSSPWVLQSPDMVGAGYGNHDGYHAKTMRPPPEEQGHWFPQGQEQVAADFHGQQDGQHPDARLLTPAEDGDSWDWSKSLSQEDGGTPIKGEPEPDMIEGHNWLGGKELDGVALMRNPDKLEKRPPHSVQPEPLAGDGAGAAKTLHPSPAAEPARAAPTVIDLVSDEDSTEGGDQNNRVQPRNAAVREPSRQPSLILDDSSISSSVAEQQEEDEWRQEAEFVDLA